jgi:hypothetical protein
LRIEGLRSWGLGVEFKFGVQGSGFRVQGSWLKRYHVAIGVRGWGDPKAVQRFRGGLALKAQRLFKHSTQGSRVKLKKSKKVGVTRRRCSGYSSLNL